MTRLICPDCGKKGVTRREGKVVSSEEHFACRYCEFSTFTGGSFDADIAGRGRLAWANPDGGLPEYYLTDAAMVREQRVPGTVFITPDGSVYRLERAGLDAMTDRYRESFTILVPGGGASTRDLLPHDAVCVWEPQQ